MGPKIKVVRVHDEARLPQYAHDGDAAFDLFSTKTMVFRSGTAHSVPTGIKLEIPNGYAGLIWAKTGLAIKHGLKVLGVVIDSGYRGEVMVGMTNLTDNEYSLEKGEKIAQMIIQKVEQAVIEEVEELSETKRGEGGFGSTGK